MGNGGVARTLAAAVWVVAVIECRGTAASLLARPGPPMAIVLLAAASAVLGSRLASGRVGTPRLAPTFVLAGAIALPSPVGLLAALVAGLAGRGAAVAGPLRHGPASYAGLAVSAWLVQRLAAGAAGLQDDPTRGLPALLLLGLLLEGGSWVVVRLVSREREPRDGPRFWRRALRESVNAPLAWLLAGLTLREAWWQAGALAAAVLAASVVVGRLARVQETLRRARTALASRVTELDTLDSIGRGVLVSRDADRVCATVDRELRKILPADACVVALRDREGSRLRGFYRRVAGEVEPAAGGLDAHPAGAPMDVGRGLRVDDLERLSAEDPLRRGRPAADLRAALIVPLLVEERPVGVLSVYSTSPGAYDDHQLSVLRTVAQQTAAAIEGARHYHLANVDSLTGFSLRDYFFARLQEEHRRVSRYGGLFSLLMIDLDDFKRINDRHGHLVGDQYLKAVAGTIGSQLRGVDLACRYGGDEFCLLLPETGASGGVAIAERIREAIANHVVCAESGTLRSTASIGVAAFPDHDTGAVEDLVRAADRALYRAKRGGRDRVEIDADACAPR